MPGVLVTSPNSVTSFEVAAVNVPDPNTLVRDDDSRDIEAARQRFSKKNRFLSLPSLRKRSRKRSEERVPVTLEARESDHDEDIALDGQDRHPINVTANPIVTYDESQDHYEWAIVYENQRG